MCPNCKIHLHAVSSKDAAVEFFWQKIWCWTSFQLFWFLFGDSPDSLILWTLHSGLHIKDPSFHVFICFSFLIFTFGLIIETKSLTRSSASIRVRCECVKFFFISWSAEVLWKLSSMHLMYESGSQIHKKTQTEQEKQFVRGRWKAFLRP